MGFTGILTRISSLGFIDRGTRIAILGFTYFLTRKHSEVSIFSMSRNMILGFRLLVTSPLFFDVAHIKSPAEFTGGTAKRNKIMALINYFSFGVAFGAFVAIS